MIKSLVAGIWSVTLLLGSLYFFGMMKGEPVAQGEEVPAKLDHVKLETMSITIIRENTLQGYLILDVSFEFEAKNKRPSSAPAELVLMDAINREVFMNKEIDIDNLDRFDFDGFKEKVKLAVNEKLGETFARDVLIERLDFISYEEIRDKKLRG